MASTQDEPKTHDPEDAPEVAAAPPSEGEPEVSAAPPVEDAPAEAGDAGEEGEAAAAGDAGEEGEAAAAGATPVAVVTVAKPAGGQAMSAGQRLAAAKAAKAAKKSAARGKDATKLEDQAIARATEAADWLRINQTKIATALVGALVVGIAIVGWGYYSGRKAQEASGLLMGGVTTVLAPVVPGVSDSETESYESAEARVQAALPKLREVVAQHPNTSAAVWASLAEGAELLGSGNLAESRRAYEKVLASSHGNDFTRAQALEGIGFTYEAENQLDQALSRFEELGQLEGGLHRDLADYHLARVKAAKGDSAAAIAALRELVARLQADDAPPHPYLQGEAEARLSALDPTFGGGSTGMPSLQGPGGGAYPNLQVPGGDMTEEQLQELIRQIQEQQRAAGSE